jgi:hypothetical protein
VLPVAESGAEALRRTEQRAVVLQLERLMDYPMVRERVEAGKLSLHGWHYVIEDGEVHVFDVRAGGFVPAPRPTRRHRALPAPRKPQLVCPAGSLRALQTGGRCRRRRRLPGPEGRHQRAQLRRPELRRRAGARRRGARARAGRAGADGAQHLRRRARPSPWYSAPSTTPRTRCRRPDRGRHAVLADARDHHPQLRLHLSVQASATTYEAIEFYRERYGIERAVLPRVLTLQQVQHLPPHRGAEIEVFGFGSLCVMVEGRCALSSYATGQSPNTAGVCSPPSAVRWDEAADGVARPARRRADRPLRARRAARLPDAVQGPLRRRGQRDYALEEPTSLNTLSLLPQLIEAASPPSRSRAASAAPATWPRSRGVAQRHRRSCAPTAASALQRAAGLETRSWRAGPRASSTPWAPTTAPGDE